MSQAGRRALFRRRVQPPLASELVKEGLGPQDLGSMESRVGKALREGGHVRNHASSSLVDPGAKHPQPLAVPSVDPTPFPPTHQFRFNVCVGW